MKKSITGMVALLAGVFVAYSQGQVSFANYYNGGNYVTVEWVGHPIGGTASHTGYVSADIHDGNDWSVELYGIAGANQPLYSLVPAILDGTVSTLVTATLAGGGSGPFLGQWYSTEVGDISGTTFANQPATVAVAAWYNNGGTITSYSSALANEVPSSFSATGNIITGGPHPGGGTPSPPAFLPQLGNGIIEMALLPEPGTIALSVMGAFAFLMRMPRKQ